MLCRYLFAPAILSIAGLLMASDAAVAQFRSGPVGVNHGGYHGAYYGGYHGGYYHPGYQGGYYHGNYPYYYGGYWPGYYSTYRPYWYDSYYSPRYSYYVDPTVTYAQPAPVPDSLAHIRVILPDPQARVWFDGFETKQAGTERLFDTPALSPGVAYNYHIRASWIRNGQEVAQERTVNVTAGQTAVVDFNQPANVASATNE